MPNVKKTLMGAAGAGGGGTKKLFVWGMNAHGGLGLGDTTNRNSPVQLGDIGDWDKATVTGRGHSLFIKPDKTLWAAGRNTYGQLGTGNTTSYSSPVQIGSLDTWNVIATTYQSTGGFDKGSSAAIKTDGSLWTWGRNQTGSLGLGDTTDRSSPTQVGALTNWKKISLGRSWMLALKTDGTIWSWGYNNQLRLGQSQSSNTFSVSSPVQIGSLTTFIDIAAGPENGAACRSDGKTYAWGQGYFKATGQGGTVINQSSPVLVGGGFSFTSLSAGGFAFFGRQADGSIFSWGRGYGGGLGTGSITNDGTPSQIGALTDWRSFNNTDSEGNTIFMNQQCNTGNMQGMLTKTDGTFWVWGKNHLGNLGLGNTTDYSSPVQVGSSTKWLFSYAGYAGGCAFEDGS